MVKKGRIEAIQTADVYFQRYHCLSVSSVARPTWEKSRLLLLETILVARYSPKSYLDRSLKSSGNNDLAILA